LNLLKHIAQPDKSARQASAHPFFQPKLSVNQPNDVYEQEADSMADKVMRTANEGPHQGFFRSSTPMISRKCEHCEEEKMQRKDSTAETPNVSPQTESYISSLNGKGRSLNQQEKNFFEPRLGHDLSSVQLHTDNEANASARDVSALAYTHKNHIVFGAGQYQPGTDSGKRLMAHELTHVVQQKASNVISRVPTRSGSKDGRYNFSSNCGWIDWSHADAGLANELIKRVQKASDDLRAAGTNATAATGDLTSPTMTSQVPKTSVILSSAAVNVRLLQPLSASEVISVALSIFKTLSISFEAQQLWTDLVGESSFAQEDLPSDLISFYMAVKGYSPDDIKKYCGAVGPDESVAEYDRNHDFKKNKLFSPIGATGTWPAELSTIDDSQASALYETRTINAVQGLTGFTFCPMYRIEGTVGETDWILFGYGGTNLTASDNVRVVPTYQAEKTTTGTYGSTTMIEVEPYSQPDFFEFKKHGLKWPMMVPNNVLVCLSSKGNKV
jgi:hypothetical protein